MKELLLQIDQCRVCASVLPVGARPIMAAGPHSKIVIISQAPGRKVHDTGIPWNDKSGETLRSWMGVDKKTFYDTSLFALVPMGFCYPGKARSGDLPPRPECSRLWHARLLHEMKEVQLTLLVGHYAQRYYLEAHMGATLTATVRHFTDYLPNYFPLPHPSPRNNIWFRRNPWFEDQVLPQLKHRVRQIITER